MSTMGESFDSFKMGGVSSSFNRHGLKRPGCLCRLLFVFCFLLCPCVSASCLGRARLVDPAACLPWNHSRSASPPRQPANCIYFSLVEFVHVAISTSCSNRQDGEVLLWKPTMRYWRGRARHHHQHQHQHQHHGQPAGSCFLRLSRARWLTCSASTTLPPSWWALGRKRPRRPIMAVRRTSKRFVRQNGRNVQTSSGNNLPGHWGTPHPTLRGYDQHRWWRPSGARLFGMVHHQHRSTASRRGLPQIHRWSLADRSSLPQISGPYDPLLGRLFARSELLGPTWRD